MYKYKKIKLKDGSTKDEHKLIWEQANGKIPKGFILHHKNRDGRDNRLENLDIISRAEHARLHLKGTSRSEATKRKLQIANRKSRSGAKLTVNDVIAVREMLKSKVSVSDVAYAFNVCKRTIYDIKNKKTWGWLKEGDPI